MATYDFLGIAEFKAYAKAQAEGKEFPFLNHPSGFIVDLNAIPLGARVASVMTMKVLAR